LIFVRSDTLFHSRLFRTYMSIPGRLQAVLQKNHGATLY
jgi:hypothetical protein